MKSKKTTDARSYSHDALEKIRIDAVCRVEAGKSPEDAIAGLGMTKPAQACIDIGLAADGI
jgi:hypothetical protein